MVGCQLARGDCVGAASTLLDRAQPARALEVARACGALESEAVAGETAYRAVVDDVIAAFDQTPAGGDLLTVPFGIGETAGS